MSTVGITVARAREVAGQLDQQLRLVDGLRKGHGTILDLALDWGVLQPIRTAMGEFTEDTGNSATLLRALANYSEAADNGAEGGELAYFEALAISALQRVQAGLDDGVGSAATDAEVNASLDAYLSSDEYLHYQLQYGDFDLSTSIEGGPFFSDATFWRDGIVHENPPDNVEYNGGGGIVGPDGQIYPIIIPTLVADDGTRYSHQIGDLDGWDTGWTTTAYRTGVEQFSADVPLFGKLIITGAGATGLDTGEHISDDSLPGLFFRLGQAPLLGAVPRTYDTRGYESAGSGRAAGTVDNVVTVTEAVQTFQNVNSNVDRAYEVVFQEHESGARRATLTTHRLGASNGQPFLTAWDVYVNEDNQLSQIPAIYRPPDIPQFEQGGIRSAGSGIIRTQGDLMARPLRVGQTPIDVIVNSAS